ncbi:MAG: hypothetical protein AAGJ10_17970 [Bacteroidota bacterium]
MMARTSVSPFALLFTAVVVGTVFGGLFGVFFGAAASLFHNGPETMVGITESWPWFAVVGAAMGFGAARNRISDNRS